MFFILTRSICNLPKNHNMCVQKWRHFYINCKRYLTIDSIVNYFSLKPMSFLFKEPATKIRLMNGDTEIKSPPKDEDITGRVEVFYNNDWGTICDDQFSDTDALVLCNMRGFPFG